MLALPAAAVAASYTTHGRRNRCCATRRPVLPGTVHVYLNVTELFVYVRMLIDSAESSVLDYCCIISFQHTDSSSNQLDQSTLSRLYNGTIDR